MSVKALLFRSIKVLFRIDGSHGTVAAADIERVMVALSRKEERLRRALAACDNPDEMANLELDLKIILAHKEKGFAAVRKLNGNGSP